MTTYVLYCGVKERYDLLFELYGVQSRGWSMLHDNLIDTCFAQITANH